MTSGFTGGGGNSGSDYFSAVDNLTSGGRSASSLSNMINNTTTTNNNLISNNGFQQNPYRSLIAGAGSVFSDPLSHLQNGNNQHQQRRGLIGKRTLAEFQTHQQQNQNQHQQQNSFNVPQNLYQQQQNKELISMYLKSVKPRIHQNTSPISPLSPIDLLNELPSSSRRYGMSQLNHQQQLLRSQQQIPSFGNNNNNSYQNFSIPNLVAQQQQPQQQQQFTVEQQQITVQKTVTETEAYQLVEKELFEEDVDDYTQHFDEESIITATTGWDELIVPSNEKANNNNNPISPSSSSTCSSTVQITSTSAQTSSKQSLMEVATAISEGRSKIAAEILTRALSQPGFVNQQGTAEQKCLFYVTAALRSRLNVSPVVAAAERSDFSWNQFLNQNSSCFKLGLMAANLSIIEATADAQSIHVVDFSIGQGFQYHSLIQLLVLRKSGKPKLVKITFVDLSANYDKASSTAVGEKLTQIGNLAGIPVQFTSLNINLRDLTRESLHSDSDEVLVVNMAHTLYRIADESVSTDNPRDHLLRRVKGLKPRVATIVEQELNCNSSQLGSRLNECCSYYGALFDSLDSALAKDNPERVNIEKEVSQKIMNSIAREGIDRVERCEVYGKWRARMSMAGFQMKPLSQPITESVKNRVSGRGVNPNLSIKEENGGICFGWMGRTLIVVSSWC